jgi:UPF0716 family protein affecting phage T7 exclusion
MACVVVLQKCIGVVFYVLLVFFVIVVGLVKVSLLGKVRFHHAKLDGYVGGKRKMNFLKENNLLPDRLLNKLLEVSFHG